MNEPIFVPDASQAIDIFGDPFPESYLMYAVLAFMSEGNQCYIMRIGVECEPGQPTALDDVCIDTSGARGRGWGRIPLFTGIDFGRIMLRGVSSSSPLIFHNASIGAVEFNDAVFSSTDGATDATLNITGTYDGIVDDHFVMIITGAPTASDPALGATFQVIRNSDGEIITDDVLTGSLIDLGNGLTIEVDVTTGSLDVNDTFLFSVAPNNRRFTVSVEGDTPTQHTMPIATYTDVASFVDAFNAVIGTTEDYLMVEFTLEDGTVVPQLRTAVEGRRIQLGALDINGLPDNTGAFALQVGKKQFEWDIPRSYLIGLDGGPYTITTSNNVVSLNVIGTSTTRLVTINLPVGTSQSPELVSDSLNAAGVVAGERFFESFVLRLPDGTDHVVIATPLSGLVADHLLDTLYLLANYSNLKTLRFAETLEILYPYTRSYRGFTDHRLTLPHSGEALAATPLSCEVDSLSAECAADTAYFENIVGWLVAPSAGTWLNLHTVTLGVATSVVGDPSGRYDLIVHNSSGVEVDRVQDVSFDQTHPRYIANVMNPGSSIGGRNGSAYLNYEARPAYLGNDPTTSDPANPYVVRQPSPFQGREFEGMADGIPLDPAYSSALDSAVIGNQAESTGIFAFENPEKIDVTLLATPGYSSGAVIGQALQMCERRGDVLYIVDPPFGLRPQQVVDWHNGMLLSDLRSAINSSYGALYWGWLQSFDQFNRIQIWVPPSGHVTSVFARTARVAEQWFAPAGLRRGRLSTALEVEYSPSAGERDLLYGSGNAVNPITKFPQDGIVIWGQRTLQRTSSVLDRVNVRMLFIHIKKTLVPLLRNYIFEPNDRILWATVRAAIEPLLGDIQARRGLSGYSVVCDQRNNTPDRIAAGQLWVSVFLQPTPTVEFVLLNLVALQTGSSFAAAEVLAAGGVVSAAG